MYRKKGHFCRVEILLTVPISSPMRSQKNVPEQLKLADFADKSLLILDDDDPLRGRLARAMEKKGFQVKEAKTVAEGLNIAKQLLRLLQW